MKNKVTDKEIRVVRSLINRGLLMAWKRLETDSNKSITEIPAKNSVFRNGPGIQIRLINSYECSSCNGPINKKRGECMAGCYEAI